MGDEHRGGDVVLPLIFIERGHSVSEDCLV
jgi:hypothetical protein